MVKGQDKPPQPGRNDYVGDLPSGEPGAACGWTCASVVPDDYVYDVLSVSLFYLLLFPSLSVRVSPSRTHQSSSSSSPSSIIMITISFFAFLPLFVRPVLGVDSALLRRSRSSTCPRTWSRKQPTAMGRTASSCTGCPCPVPDRCGLSLCKHKTYPGAWHIEQYQ